MLQVKGEDNDEAVYSHSDDEAEGTLEYDLLEAGLIYFVHA